MARFCTQCGRPLAEGEVCTCTQQAQQQWNSAAQMNYQQSDTAQQNVQGGQQYGAGAQQYTQNNQQAQQYDAGAQQYSQNTQQYNQNVQGAQQYGQNMQGAQQYNQNMQGTQQYGPNGQPIPGQYGPVQPAQPSQAMIKLTQFGHDLLATLKNPVKAIGEVAARNDFLYGIITVGIDAIVVFFVTIIIMARLNGMLGSLISMLGGYSYYGSISLPVISVAFITFFAVIAAYAAQAGVLFGMTKLFSKNTPITFFQALTYMGGKAFYSAMVAILTCLCVMINVPFGLVVFMIGSTFAFLIGAMSYYQTTPADGSIKVYVLLIVYVVNLIVVYVAARIFISAVMSKLGLSIGTLLNILSDF